MQSNFIEATECMHCCAEKVRHLKQFGAYAKCAPAHFASRCGTYPSEEKKLTYMPPVFQISIYSVI